MKKVLLGTSALALIGAYAGPASAAEFEMRIGGYFEGYLAFAASDVDTVPDAALEIDGVDAKQDTEIRFRPRIVLDNGISIGADIQLEANTSSDTIDESFIRVEGSFGEFLLGSENSAGAQMFFAAPDVTFVNVNSGSLTAFIPFSGGVGGVSTGDDAFRRTLGTTFLEVDGNNDAQRFTYFTPRFAGVQLGVSYARDGDQDSNVQENIEGRRDANIVDFGANYVNSFGGFDVAVAGRYGIAFSDEGDNGNNPQVFGVGANLGFAGVTIGGSYAEANNTGDEDGTAYDAGISYETGPWGFSFTYFRGESVDDEVGSGGNFGQFGNDEELQQFLVGVNYKLAKGVNLGAFGAYVDFDEDTDDTGTVTGDDVDGFVIGTGIKISF